MKRKILSALAASAMYGGLLCVIYGVHVRFFPVDVVFYAAVLDGVLAVMVAGFLVFLPGCCAVFTSFEKLLLVMVWLLAGYAWAVTVPTVIDRSLSIYILEKLQQRGGALRQEAMKEVFVREYLREHRLVEVRLTEQLESGTILLENGCVILTPKGAGIAAFTRYFRKHWLPKKRLLMREYTDVLTDPFRDSAPTPEAVCP